MLVMMVMIHLMIIVRVRVMAYILIATKDTAETGAPTGSHRWHHTMQEQLSIRMGSSELWVLPPLLVPLAVNLS